MKAKLECQDAFHKTNNTFDAVKLKIEMEQIIDGYNYKNNEVSGIWDCENHLNRYELFSLIMISVFKTNAEFPTKYQTL